MIRLFEHQKKAFYRFRDKDKIPLLFSCGTGKTITTLAIAYHKYLQGEIDVLMVIAPNGVHKQWALGDVERFFDGDKRFQIVVTYKKTQNIKYVPGRLNIVCTNIETFSTKNAWIPYRDFAIKHKTFLVLDEATRIKNPKSQRTLRLLYEFNDVQRRGRAIIKSTPLTVARAILTGTAVTNSPFEVWSMFEFLEPNWCDLTYTSFQSYFGAMRQMTSSSGKPFQILINEDIWKAVKHCRNADDAYINFGVPLAVYETIKSQDKWEGPYRHLDELRDMLAQRAMMVTLEDVVDMPDRVYERRLVEMTKEQKVAYKTLRDDLMALLPKGDVVEVSSIMTSYMKLQQITSGFIIKNKDEFEEDPKPAEVFWFKDIPPKLEALLDDISEMDKPVIVATHFTCEASLIYDTLVNEGYRVCLMTGWKKVGTIEEFQEGKYDVMVANIRVISMGFNLQISHYMMYYSSTFSLEDRIQSEARIYRSGQTKTCFYYDYVCEGTIDEKIEQALKSKKTISDFILETPKENLYT